MRAHWLIESNVWDEQDRIAKEVERQGMVCKVASYRPGAIEHDWKNLFDGNDCVVCYGSMEFMQQIRRERPFWVPGAYYNLPQYDCTKYYPALGKLLLNRSYIMLPYGEMLRRQDELFSFLGAEGALFVRPNVGSKPFAGKLIFQESYAKDIKDLGFYDVKPHELVVVAEPQNIRHEWRFVIANRKVVDGCLYQYEGKKCEKHEFPQKAWDLAQQVADLYEPERCWTVDICEDRYQDFSVMEIGSFSSAGMYACDLKKVVAAVSEAAYKEWEEYKHDTEWERLKNTADFYG